MGQVKRVVLGGAFQDIHEGHLWLLREAKRMGHLTVVVASDETVKRRKTLLKPQWQRVEMVKGTGIPDSVVAGGNDRVETLLRLDPDIVVLGHDQEDWVTPIIRKFGLKAEVVRLGKFGEYSTTGK